MTGVLGHAITLSCPQLNIEDVASGTRLSFKEWFRGPVSSTEAMVARMMTIGIHVEENSTAVSRVFISSMDGNLTIQNLTLEDAGLYTCSFTGSDVQTIQLNVIIGMFEWSVYRYKYQCFSTGAILADRKDTFLRNVELLCSYYISFAMINSLHISAKVVSSVLGHAITLSCPVTSSGNATPRPIKEWFRGLVPHASASVARLLTNRDPMEYNHTVAEKMRFSSLDGDLIIENLTLEDMGFYTCHFTGSKAQTIQLYVEGMFDWFLKDMSYSSKISKRNQNKI